VSQINQIWFAQSAFADESQTAQIYQRLSKDYGESKLGAELGNLAKTEAMHASFWISFLRKRGVDTAGARTSRAKTTLFRLVFRLFGVGLGLKLLERGENAAIANYGSFLESEEASLEEKAALKGILADELGHEDELEEYGKRYKFFTDRVADILTQVSGGLVTVLSVTAGLTGVYNQPFIAGIAGMLVGLTQTVNSTVSYYFYSSTVDKVKRGVLKRLGTSIDVLPELFAQRLVSHLQKEQMSERAARMVGEDAARKKDLLRRMIAERSYSIYEAKLENPAKVALYAGVFRIIGTFLPLVPYFANLPTYFALPLSVLITLATLALTGFLVALVAEVGFKRKIAELMLSGLALTVIALLMGYAAASVIALLP
jgi:VIT1/CCC1 family predicted Fe2+/Mn2+ transporter